MPADQPDHRHFRLRVGAPQIGECRIGQHRQCLAADLGLFLGGEAMHRQRQKTPGRGFALFEGQFRQALQQLVDQEAALEAVAAGDG